MPACKDLTGQKFNKLTVLRKTDKRKYGGAVVWECKCDCGNIVEEISSNLTRGKVKSCGCAHNKIEQGRASDLVGQRFGRLTVIEMTNKRANNRCIIYKCQCDCGNIVEVPSDRLLLKNRPTQSCGCLQIDEMKEWGKTQRKDLTNQKFGKLTALFISKDGDKRFWHCKCDCGNECDVNARYLMNGHCKSCGCLKTSYGEYIIAKLLQENNIYFEKEKMFDDCKFLDTNYYARFDFYVDNKYIIEFDGPQHYDENYFLNSSLEKIQEHDTIKNNWCFKHNIPIIRIPYYISNKIKINDLKLETSKYILKERG